VLLQICDAYLRRNDKQERVIGTLLGIAGDGVIQINRCYVVPHNESADQVAVDVNHHKTMFDMNQRVSPAQSIVGWFSSSNTINSSDALIQDFYTREVGNTTPIHLVVDTTLSSEGLHVSAYTSHVLTLGDKTLATEFVEVPCEVLYTELEKVGADLMVSGDHEKSKALVDSDNLRQSIVHLQQLVGQAQQYVEAVVAGKQKGDAAIGRYLADTLAVVPRFDPATFEKLFNEGVQDGLLVSYFAHLVRSQVALSERLGTPMLPLL